MKMTMMMKMKMRSRPTVKSLNKNTINLIQNYRKLSLPSISTIHYLVLYPPPPPPLPPSSIWLLAMWIANDKKRKEKDIILGFKSLAGCADGNLMQYSLLLLLPFSLPRKRQGSVQKGVWMTSMKRNIRWGCSAERPLCDTVPLSNTRKETRGFMYSGPNPVWCLASIFLE